MELNAKKASNAHTRTHTHRHVYEYRGMRKQLAEDIGVSGRKNRAEAQQNFKNKIAL